MLFRDVIDLRTVNIGKDEEGLPIETVTTRTNIFANKKSIRGNDFYKAYEQGITLDIMFIIRSIDFSGERELMYSGNIYDIIRTYDKGEMIELICQRRSNKNVI